MIYENKDQLKKGCEATLSHEGGDVRILDEERFRSRLIDDLIQTVAFSPDQGTRKAAGFLIRRGAAALGIVSSSIQALYDAMGRGEVGGFTVPAINIRGISYDGALGVTTFDANGQTQIPVAIEIKEVKDGAWVTRAE